MEIVDMFEELAYSDNYDKIWNHIVDLFTIDPECSFIVGESHCWRDPCEVNSVEGLMNNLEENEVGLHLYIHKNDCMVHGFYILSNVNTSPNKVFTVNI